MNNPTNNYRAHMAPSRYYVFVAIASASLSYTLDAQTVTPPVLPVETRQPTSSEILKLKRIFDETTQLWIKWTSS